MYRLIKAIKAQSAKDGATLRHHAKRIGRWHDGYASERLFGSLTKRSSKSTEVDPTEEYMPEIMELVTDHASTFEFVGNKHKDAVKSGLLSHGEPSG